MGIAREITPDTRVMYCVWVVSGCGMSRRRIEQGISAPSSFSLRAIATGSQPLSVGAAIPIRSHSVSVAPPPVPAHASLSFKFSSLAVATSPGIAAAPKPPLTPPALPANFFSRQTVSSKESHDTMRLTAVVDELTQRLRKVGDAKTTAETQLARTGQALTTERQAHAAKIQAMKSEMATVQDMAMGLRSELAQRPAMREVNPLQFDSRVRFALEQEETNARVADAESRVAMLLKRAEGLTAEVKIMEGRKHTHLSEANSELSEDEIEALVQRAAEAQTKLAAAEDQKAAIQDSIDRLTALRDAHREEADVAATQLAQANLATTQSVTDSHAARRQVKDLLDEHDEVKRALEVKRAEIAALSVARPMASFTVTGAEAPKRRDLLVVTDTAKVESFSCCSTGLPFHFAHDAPLNITAATGATPQGDEIMDTMVNALVSDLKDYFTFAAEDHAKIGRVEVVAATTGNTTEEDAA